MTTYDWPADDDWQPLSGSFRLSTIAALSSSPYTGAHKAASLGQIWVATLSFNAKELTLSHQIAGFLNMLEGPVNPVRLFDWWRPVPVCLDGDAEPWSDATYFSDGSGWVDGYAPLLIADATQGSNVLVMEGLPASTECFRRGDLIGVGGYLYELKFGVTANSSGEAAVTVQPGLRAGAAINDSVQLYRPTLPMRLATDADAVINRSHQTADGFTLTFVEDIP